MADLLGRMTPAAARLDLQSSAFQELLAQQELTRKQAGTVCSTEPWCALLPHTLACLEHTVPDTATQPSQFPAGKEGFLERMVRLRSAGHAGTVETDIVHVG